MIPGKRRIGWQEGGIGQFVAGGEFEDGEIIGAGDQHEPVQTQAPGIREILGQADGTDRPVGFADHVFGRAPALIAIDVEPDKVPDRANIILVADEAVLIVGAGIARTDRVNEHQVGQIKDGIAVVLKRCGQRGCVSVFGQHHALRPHEEIVGIGARGTGAAVEDEGNGTGAHILHVVEGIGNGKDLTAFAAALDNRGTGRGGIAVGLSLHDHAVFCRNQIVPGRGCRRRIFLREGGNAER